MINKVILLGNLGQDPEVKELQNGKVCSFSVATTRKWKTKDGEKQEQTEWHNVVAFGTLANICGQYLRKGSKVYIEGRIQTRKWEDKEGKTNYRTEVIAEDLKMLDGKPQGQAAPQGRGDGHSYSEDLAF